MSLCGSAAFREQAAREATRLGIGVRDADLRAVVAHGRAQMRHPARGRNVSH